MESVRIVPIEMGSKEYDKEMILRTKVLREPLGLKYSPEDLIIELDDIHLGAFINNELVGCVLLRPQLEGKMKMRQLAVENKFQKKKVGTKLVKFAEVLAKKMGYSMFELHSRQSAVSFYEALGYEAYGEVFEEVTLPHRKMRKTL
jgi:predicted GNAT family N-acyltransferase